MVLARAGAATAAAALLITLIFPLLACAAPPMGPYRSAAASFRARRSAASSSASGARASSPASRNAPDPSDLIAQCQLRWRNATLDHFSFAEGDDETFPQRYFVCDRHWRRPAPSPSADAAAAASSAEGSTSAGPIFFYAGNEADVLLYLNHTGLMWENAERFGALLVFAEHRFYGESRPPPPKNDDDAALPPSPNASARRLRERLSRLSASQAMADYAELLRDLRKELEVPYEVPVAAFGGSYGGMLASWLRMRYPETIDAAVASSAPIFNFVGMDPPYPPNSFAAAVTADATPEVGGAAAACAPNVRSGWRALAFLSGHSEDAAAEHGESDAGDDAKADDANSHKKKQRSRREAAAEAMRLCDAKGQGADLLERRSGFLAARNWLSSAWDYMAMGDFPYATSYMTNGQGELPAFPVRAACEWLADPALADWEGAEEEAAVDGSGSNNSNSTAKELGALRLLEAMTDAAGVFFNYTGADVECYEPAGGEDPLSLSSARHGNSGDADAANATTDQLRVSPQMLAAARQFLSPEDARALERAAAGVSSSPGARSSNDDDSSNSTTDTAADAAADADADRGDSSALLGSGDDPTALDAFLWDWQYCSEMLMPFGKDGVNDFYWDEPWDLESAIETCKNNWAGLAPRAGWAPAHYGSRGALRSATRITFPSGALDPWRPGSPLEVPPQASAHTPPLLDAFTLPSGAHHIDTFFSDPADPPDVTAGRRRILDLLARWLDDARAERAAQRRREVGDVEDGGERRQRRVEEEQEGVV
jgi:hypothetical protein